MVKIRPATAADFEALNADMRDADRAECRVFGQEGESPKDWQEAYAIEVDGDFLGLVGWALFCDTTPISNKRLFLLMTTNKVWKHKLTYVKKAKAVMKLLVDRLPSWVTDIYALPMTSYKASIKWQEKVLGFKVLGTELLNGVEHTRMHIKRNEVTL